MPSKLTCHIKLKSQDKRSHNFLNSGGQLEFIGNLTMTLIPNATTTVQLPTTHTRPVEPRNAAPHTAVSLTSSASRSHEKAAASTPASAPKHVDTTPKH